MVHNGVFKKLNNGMYTYMYMKMNLCVSEGSKLTYIHNYTHVQSFILTVQLQYMYMYMCTC